MGPVTLVKPCKDDSKQSSTHKYDALRIVPLRLKSKCEIEFDHASVQVKFLMEFVGSLHKGACQANVSQNMAQDSQQHYISHGDVSSFATSIPPSTQKEHGITEDRIWILKHRIWILRHRICKRSLFWEGEEEEEQISEEDVEEEEEDEEEDW